MSDNESKVIDIVEKLHEITECSICKDTFQEPKILSCVHTFCRKCLQDIATNQTKGPGDQIACPLCRKVLVIPEDGFAGLARNFFMERLIEIQNLLKPSSTTIEVCEACPDDIRSDAEVYCVDCQLRLCVNCHRHHTRSKVTKNHRIISVGASGEVEIPTVEKMMAGFCTTHARKPLEIYCSSCSDTVCTTCFFDNHRSHKVEEVAFVVGGFQKKIRDNIDSLENYIAVLEQRSAVLENQKLELIQNSAGLETELSRSRGEMIALITEHYNSIVQELSTHRSEALKRMEVENETGKTLLVSLQSYKRYCEQVTTLGSASNICRNINELNARADELRILCDSHVQEISNSCEVVGLLQLVQTKSKPSEILRCADGNLFGRLQEVEAQSLSEKSSEKNCSEDTAKEKPAEESNERECGTATDTPEESVRSMEVIVAKDKSGDNATENICVELEFERQRCQKLEATILFLKNIIKELGTNEEQLNDQIEEMEAPANWFDASS